jgi:hypothetical protein
VRKSSVDHFGRERGFVPFSECLLGYLGVHLALGV